MHSCKYPTTSHTHIHWHTHHTMQWLYFWTSSFPVLANFDFSVMSAFGRKSIQSVKQFSFSSLHILSQTSSHIIKSQNEEFTTNCVNDIGRHERYIGLLQQPWTSSNHRIFTSWTAEIILVHNLQYVCSPGCTFYAYTRYAMYIKTYLNFHNLKPYCYYHTRIDLLLPCSFQRLPIQVHFLSLKSGCLFEIG